MVTTVFKSMPLNTKMCIRDRLEAIRSGKEELARTPEFLQALQMCIRESLGTDRTHAVCFPVPQPQGADGISGRRN